MDNQTLHDRFRNQLTNVHALTVLTVSLFEIVAYIILVVSKVEIFSINNRYLWYGVIVPIIINIITHLIARLIVKAPNVNRQQKNKTIITAALITSFIVAVVHKEYIVTSCAFIFPIVLSSMFNDKKLLNVTFIASIFILFSVGLAFWLDKSITLGTSINLFVLFGFSFISFLCGIISINFSKQNYTTIETQAAENDKLLQDVLRDQMTGLYNHTSFITQLDNDIQKFGNDVSLCMVMVDVDDFKRINDTYGHDCGDAVLTKLAKIIKKHCKNTGTAFRYGGEEFAILFLKKSTKEVFEILENILKEFRTHNFNFTNRPITFSGGIAEYSAEMTRDEFFEKADKTLYKAKQEGKNRILVAK